MVNFKEGTLVKGAYVVINGVEYPVIMPEYSGDTPVSPENLNKLQKDINDDVTAKYNTLNNKINGTVLYDNSTGISGKESLTLSQNISNFSTIKIVYDVSNDSNINNRYARNAIKEFDVSNSTEDLLISENINSPYYASVSITGTTLNIIRNRVVNNGNPAEGNYIIITKVIGYKAQEA